MCLEFNSQKIKIRFFAINVKNNKYRRERIKSQCLEFDIPIEIFDAITPKTISLFKSKYSPVRTTRQWGRPLLPTEQACGLSHIFLWQQLIRDKTADAYVIFEDDAKIIGDFVKLIPNIFGNKIHFVKFSGQHTRPQKKIKDIGGGYSLFKGAYGPLDASAYLLTKHGARKLIDYCEPLHAAIDVLMDRSYEHGVTVFSVQPYPVQSLQCSDPESPLFSDIGIRNEKYISNSSFLDRFYSRLYRFKLSIKKRIAEAKLYLERS